MSSQINTIISEKLMMTLPCADAAGHVLDGPSFLLQLLSHVLQILPMVPVGILQKLVARYREYSKYTNVY